jgi:error-prone DNA polymerase
VPLVQAGRLLLPNGERHLRERARLARLYPPALLAETLAIAARCRFSLDELRYEYPREIVPEGWPASYLAARADRCAVRRRRWPQGVPANVRAHDRARARADRRARATSLLPHRVRHGALRARARGILCQGRGSAANSAVCYCLGITEVARAQISLLFERFISRERDEPPDIDVDFEHERREEVIQYIYAKYGARARRAGRHGDHLPPAQRTARRGQGAGAGQCGGRARRRMAWWDARSMPSALRERVSSPSQPVARLLALVRELLGFPRHLSQHVGGFVIARGLLSDAGAGRERQRCPIAP